ncbi:TetR/AcrR family transcriptional regulator [Kineosporia rhizophila]|uniref:TetR/AcrR family transcriptional regulator n=1 Tax=Kineosporia TaxID=49184 RepID=UPI001E5582A1|nr:MULTISPECIES: TetR/AcrR family transcriptional regulator [Kineosporia]MCE0535393.1 TetR/AcrR family transcriptional regulator [Kineosporia rhizophila]GLY16826.1 TetR family transcriptional regulator [Kineosporia sp. NBRC 101677]
MGAQQAGRRADAVRNRERLVAAAAGAFADLGLDASMNEVARRAGVGIATALRNFAHRDELVAAVFHDRMRRYAELTEAAAELPDAWEGFRQCVLQVCELQASDRGFTQVLIGAFPAAPEFESERSRAYRSFSALTRRAQTQGRLRADFAPNDLMLILMANAGVIAHTLDQAPDAWRRLVGYFLQSLSAEHAEPLPVPPVPARKLYLAMTAKN